MLVIGLAECYLWGACQNKFPMCNSGCNTFKAAAITLNIRRQVRNSVAADLNTCTIKENACETLGAKITLVWYTNMLICFFSVCVCAWKKWLSNVHQFATLKVWNWKGLMLRSCIRFWLSNIRKKNPCFCFIAPVLNMSKWWVWGGSVFTSLKIQLFLFLCVEKMTNFKYDYSTFKCSDELCLKTPLPCNCLPIAIWSLGCFRVCFHNNNCTKNIFKHFAIPVQNDTHSHRCASS